MNKVILIGRLTKDPDVKMTSNQTAYCNFTVAVDRRFKDNNGQKQADFINCVAWRQTATFIGNYFHKGSRIAVTGSIQTRSYDDNNGQKRYVTEVVVDEVEFVDSASSNASNRNGSTGTGYTQASRNNINAQPSVQVPEPPKAPIAPENDNFFGDGDDDVSLPFDI